MKEYIDIPDLLNFSLKNISNVEGIQKIMEEILTRFELTDKKTIRFKDRTIEREEAILHLNTLIENASSYFLIEEIWGLKEFMKTGFFLKVDFEKLHTLDENQKASIKPFINHACFLFGNKLINEYEEITPNELFNISQFTDELKAMGIDYIAEAQNKIDQEWNNKLIAAQNQYLAEKPGAIIVATTSLQSMIKWSDIDQNEYIGELTKPYNISSKTFDDCLMNIVRYFVDSVGGKIRLYPKDTLEYIIKIIDDICLKKPFEFPYYNELKNKIRELLIDKKVLDIKFVIYGLIIITFLIGMAISNL